MVQLYVKLHGTISPEYGFIVPRNKGNNVSVNMYTQPGTPLYIVGNTGNDIKDIDVSYGFNTGDFMFDLILFMDNKNYGFIKTDSEKLDIYGAKDETADQLELFRENYVIFAGKTDEYIKRHSLFQPGKFTLSMLMFEFIKMYPTEEIIVNVISCLSLRNFSQCPSIRDLFNISTNNYQTMFSKYVPKEQIAYILRTYFLDIKLPPTETDNINPHIFVTKGIIEDIQFLIVRKTSAPMLFRFLYKCRDKIASILTNKRISPGLAFVGPKSYKFVGNNVDPDFPPLKIVRSSINSYFGYDPSSNEENENYSFKDTNFIVVYAYHKTKSGMYKLVTHTTKNKTENTARVQSSRGINSIRGQLKNTKSIIDSNKINLSDRLTALYDENRSIEYRGLIGELVDKINDVTLHDVIVIPYIFICALFFPKEIVNYEGQETEGSRIPLLSIIGDILSVIDNT
jgi:hypothetical protein